VGKLWEGEKTIHRPLLVIRQQRGFFNSGVPAEASLRDSPTRTSSNAFFILANDVEAVQDV
jgi:hypothetical protein